MSHVDDECCMFTTAGRRSGRPHRLEIWFGVANDAIYMICGYGPTADWYQNALADPRVTVELGDDVVEGRAVAVTDATERREVGDLMGAKYRWDGDPSIRLTSQKWCYEVPLLRIDLVAA